MQTDIEVEQLSKTAAANSARYNFSEHGFAISPGPLLTPEEVAKVREHAERVLAGVYETGVAPRNNSGGPDLTNHPTYIEAQFPQDADDVIAEVLRNPRIAQWAAEVSGAKRLTVWSAMILKKYPSSDSTASIVGWHQDGHYLERILKGQALNVWVALDDVHEDMGPLRYVLRSNRWGRKYSTGFFDRDHDRQRSEIEIPKGESWEEVAAVIPAGWALAHPSETLHASGGNVGSKSRLSLLINMGVDDFELLPGTYFATRADDHRATPVIFDRTA
jgi:hypothetical protein